MNLGAASVSSKGETNSELKRATFLGDRSSISFEVGHRADQFTTTICHDSGTRVLNDAAGVEEVLDLREDVDAETFVDPEYPTVANVDVKLRRGLTGVAADTDRTIGVRRVGPG